MLVTFYQFLLKNYVTNYVSVIILFLDTGFTSDINNLYINLIF